MNMSIVDDTSTDVQSEKPLTAAQKARIERSRQRALLLKQSRLTSRPYPENKPNRNDKKVTQPSKVIDTGAGFLLEEDEEIDAQHVKVIIDSGPVLSSENLHCEECSKDFLESYLYSKFDLAVCDNCRDDDEKHKLITKTDAKDKYLLKDCDFDKREPALKFIVKKNPHNSRWGDMKLFLELQVIKRALEVWGSEDNIEEAHRKKQNNREKSKQKKFDKKVKDLRLAVRSSLWTKDTSGHEHKYGGESYNENQDTYSKTCATCFHTLTYEKM